MKRFFEDLASGVSGKGSNENEKSKSKSNSNRKTLGKGKVNEKSAAKAQGKAAKTAPKAKDSVKTVSKAQVESKKSVSKTQEKIVKTVPKEKTGTLENVLKTFEESVKNVTKGQTKDTEKDTKKQQRVSSKPTKQRPKDIENKIRRQKSTESVFQISKRKPTDNQFGSPLTAMNGSPGLGIYDCCAYVIVCQKHKTMAISKAEKKGYIWLPFVSLPQTRTWTDGAISGAYIVLSGGDASAYVELRGSRVIEEALCMQLFRLQLPQTQVFNIRLIYYIKLNEDYPEFKCCVDTNHLEWKSIKELSRGKVSALWGPEVTEFAAQISNPMVQNIKEYSLDEAFTYVPRDPPRNLEEEMLKTTNFTEKDVERLYTDFLEHCFPSFYMTQTSFNEYMSKYGFEKMDKKLELLFRAFNFNKTRFLTFHEILLGLASIDPMTENRQSRIKFVFKYFDADSDGYLNEKEFTSIVKEINPKDSDSEVKKKVKEDMKTIGTKKGVGVHFDDFFKAVGALKFRGTSGLCRSNQPVLAQISQSMASRTLKKSHTKVSLGSLLKNRKYKGICDSCRQKKYEYALHVVRLNEEGMSGDAQPLPDWDKIERTASKGEESDSCGQKSKSTDSIDTPSTVSTPDSNESVVRSGSLTTATIEAFSTEYIWNPKSVANYFIEQIRLFNTKKGSHQDRKGLLDGSQEKDGFVKKLQELCSAVEKIVAEEDRCAKVSSPAFVIGDIHGNLEDLLTMELVLWKSIPIVSANLVFLGDYVDRGQWGLECAIYLMSLKLLAPHKVVLLRGNHEVRALQKHYSYEKECLKKYGNSLGSKVFEMTNRVFDKLSFCAVIDDAIYCAHGGIPCTTKLIENINKVSADLRDPEKESAIAWEILWSDPINEQQFAETAELLQVRVETARGFLTNNKRGTAFFYGEEAANTFLQNNGLTHIIRAHEVPAHGFTFHFGNMCTTVFSSSHYCGNNNTSACVHIDSEKLRIICLDTVNNAPASG